MKNSALNHLIISTFLLLVFAFHPAFACQQLYSFDHSTCVFRLAFTNSSCTQFQLTQCTWQQSTGFFFTSESMQSRSWSVCTNACCGDQAFPKTMASIQTCQSRISTQRNTRVVIFWTLIGCKFEGFKNLFDRKIISQYLKIAHRYRLFGKKLSC